MKRYCAYGNKIEAVEITRETDKTVWYMEPVTTWHPTRTELVARTELVERQARKDGWHGTWFLSWDEAHADLLRRAEEKLTSARMALQRAQDEYGNVKGMKKPAEF